MEQILQKLLVADSNVIQQGTKELKEAFKKPGAIGALCDILVSSGSPQVRQTAAVVLRRKLAKKHQWSKVDAETRNRIKGGMLQALVNEPEKLVKNSIAQFIGLLGKHEFPNKTWPEVLQFIDQLCRSDNLLDKELGMYTLSIMTEISKESYIEHSEEMARLFINILNGLPDLSSNLAYYTVITMKNLVSVIGGHQQMINIYHGLLPRVLEVINLFSQNDEKRACEMFELIEELIEYAVAVIVPHVRLVIEMCLQIGSNKERDVSVQIKAIGVVGWLIRSKSKVVQKNKLIEPIIDVVMQLMAHQPEDDINEEYFEGDPDQFTSTTVAAQTLDLIALYVPPEKVVPFILTRIEPALQTNDVYAQKAAYLALAVLAEGCSEHIRNKYLESFLKCIYNGIRNPTVVVRNAAFFALGQFSEHLQPEISQYSAELLPVFFEHLTQVYSSMGQNKPEPNGLERMFYALQSFCMHLDDGLLPFLPTLMDTLLVALHPNSWSLKLKRLALSTLDSVACAVKDKILPYFDKLMEILTIYINADPNGDLIELQSYALECLASIVDNIEPEHFKPLAPQTLQTALKILSETDDPDVRKSLYPLFAALCSVMKSDISGDLHTIIGAMINTIQSSDGIIAHYVDEETDGLDIYDELSDSDNGEEDIDGESESSDDTQCRYTVENSYNEEKEQACLSITEICKHMGSDYLPFMDKSFEEIFKLVNYPQDDIRIAAILALEQFCITLYSANTGKDALYKALQMFIPKCSELIRSDEEQNIVMNALNAFANLLEEIKGDVLVGDGHREAIMNCVIDILTHKTVCQDHDVGAEGVMNEEESEQTELLLECAGEVIPKFGNALRPDDFFCYFPNILQLLTIRAKNTISISQRSFAYGTLAECMKPLSTYVEKFVPQLLHLWEAGTKDSSEEVRNNSVYGLGEMIFHGRDCLYSKYSDILVGLSMMITKESHAGTMDNICSALAKMIINNSSLVPLDQVFEVLIQHLPLKTDFQENEAIVKCLFKLYKEENPVLRTHLESVSKVIVHIYSNKQFSDKESENLTNQFMETLVNDFPQVFNPIFAAK
ncbi:PREDICTED: importin-4-like [Nicrophorus vespilloides]|uniref:Importin-4-like n=1 Tax=Nicrophorus vespilloides TaxID=110193 RepID=A0ABM1N4W0_NICVS|nr:PREDICTED: importin-4-like [Nicrophorus vespilloides]XP_017781861.1 PREDICTED: importin-4-like [Nicrophorus vespilloides]